jgi:hypothetical protein
MSTANQQTGRFYRRGRIIYAAFYRPDGSRCQFSTRTTDPVVAQRVLERREREAQAASQLGRVYFVRIAKGPIKIGRAVNVLRRVANLQTSQPYPLQLIGHIAGGREREREIHLRFKHRRLNGEWFDPAPDLLRFIAEATAQEAGTPEELLRTAEIIERLAAEIRSRLPAVRGVA